MKKSLLILFVIIFAINLNTQAEDFSAVHNGKTIYYNITSSTYPRTVEVTFRGPSFSSYSHEYSGTVSIPDSVQYSGNYYKVTLIGDYVFYDCSGLTSITIPNSVTSIGYFAFYNCYSLSSITIPNSVTSIGSLAFFNTPYYNNKPDGLVYINNVLYKYKGTMPANTSINVLSGTISISDYAFDVCTGLTSITIPNSVTSIGSGAFYYCSGLTSITIPNSVTSIGNYTFQYCGGLTSITIPSSVTSIGISAFSGCSGLTSISIPNSVTSIGNYAFSSCYGLTSITIPNSVTSIGNYAFSSCYGLTSITIPNSVTSIGGGAFSSCTSLTSITIPNSVTSIASAAFSDCSGLTSISIPNSVTSIGYSTFQNCSGLTSIICQAINPPAVQGNSFSGVSKTIPLYVPCNSIPSYNSALYWSDFTNIGIRAFQLIDTSICKGQTYTSNGFNNNLTGLYSQNLNTINGCDSLIILNLFVNPTYNDTIFAEICPGETYSQFGFNKSATGFYTQNLQTIKGCDSIVNLSLLVNPIYNDTIIAEICSNEIYTLNGFNTNVAGFYTQNLQTINGCDSIVNLSLIVNPIYLTNHYDTICQGQSYNNYGFNFIADTSGIYKYNLQAVNSCDSVICLNLFVNPIYNDTIIAEICNGETYSQFGFNENTAGFYTQSLQTIKGCDSIVNLNLIINPIYNDTILAEICSNETYTLNGFNVNTAGFYTQNLQTTKGCDSIVNLSLIVNPIYNDTIIAEICQGQTYSQYGFNVNTTGFYTQNLQTIKGCDSIVCLSLVVREPIKVNLTMVTVDNNNNNVVVWDKDEVVNHYNIYREGNVANQFDLIASVPYDSASMFVDTNSNPTIKAYMYKISTTDTCLNESELSPFHKTMHLTISQGMGNNWNLSWTPYVGANYSTYNIFRGINSLDSLKYLTTISASNTSYTDINVPSGYVYYQIEIVIDTTESKTGGNNSIRSNYATNKLISIEGVQTTDNIRTKLYPNPTEGKAKLDVEGLNTEADVLVYDMVGRVVQRHSLNKGKNDLEIDLSGYAKGVYSVRIVNDSVNQTLKLIVR